MPGKYRGFTNDQHCVGSIPSLVSLRVFGKSNLHSFILLEGLINRFKFNLDPIFEMIA